MANDLYAWAQCPLRKQRTERTAARGDERSKVFIIRCEWHVVQSKKTAAENALSRRFALLQEIQQESIQMRSVALLLKRARRHHRRRRVLQSLQRYVRGGSQDDDHSTVYGVRHCSVVSYIRGSPPDEVAIPCFHAVICNLSLCASSCASNAPANPYANRQTTENGELRCCSRHAMENVCSSSTTPPKGAIASSRSPRTLVGTSAVKALMFVISARLSR